MQQTFESSQENFRVTTLITRAIQADLDCAVCGQSASDIMTRLITFKDRAMSNSIFLCSRHADRANTLHKIIKGRSG